ncbi:cobalamin biosynthesis protein, partial [Streptomyces spiralis]
AGGAGVRWGGSWCSGGRVSPRPALHGAGRAVRVGDIERAVRLSRRVSWLALGTCAAVKLLCNRGIRSNRPTKGRRS